MVAQEINDFLTTGSIQHSVNFPDCALPPVVGHRLAILHANIPNMVGQVTSGVAKFGININSMVNRSKGANAYSVLELDSEVPAEAIEELNAVDGIFGVRAIG